jgi:hypothetical protein
MDNGELSFFLKYEKFWQFHLESLLIPSIFFRVNEQIFGVECVVSIPYKIDTVNILLSWIKPGG